MASDTNYSGMSGSQQQPIAYLDTMYCKVPVNVGRLLSQRATHLIEGHQPAQPPVLVGVHHQRNNASKQRVYSHGPRRLLQGIGGGGGRGHQQL